MKTIFVSLLLFLTHIVAAQQYSALSTAPTASFTSNDGVAQELGMHFRTSVTGNIIAAKFWKLPGMGGVHIWELYTGTGTRLAQVTFTGETASGWQQQNLTSPVTLTPNTDYICAVLYSDFVFPIYIGGLTNTITNGPLTVLGAAAAAAAGINGTSVAANSTPGVPVFPANPVTDNHNFSVDFVFSVGGNQSPNVNAGADQGITLPTSSITISGNATDADGTISSLSWTRISGPNTPTLTGTTTTTLGISGMIAGSYIYRLTATDNSGASNFDEVSITVNPASTLSAGPDQTLTAGSTTTTLSGNLPASDSVNLVVIQGESNAAGNASNNLALPNEVIPRSVVRIWNHATLRFEPLDIGTNNEQDGFIDTSKHGLELGMANQIDSGHFANPTYLVKIGVSGSYIQQWMPGDARGLWEGYMPIVDQAVAAMQAAGLKFRIIVWQSIGLNDRFGQNTNVDSFMARMNRFRTFFRNRYSNPNIHFLGTNFNNPPTSTFDWAFVWPAMHVTDPKSHEIDVHGTTYEIGDISHWDHDGFKLIAKHMVDTTNMLASGHKVMWRKISGAGGVTIVTPTSNTTNITGLAAGSYSFELTDSIGGAVYKDTVVVTVNASGGSGSTTFTAITNDFLRPGAGAENWAQRTWDNSTSPQIPAGTSVAVNYYDRLNWTDIESTTTPGSYNWTIFDSKVNNAIDNGGMFSFGIMTMCTACGLPGFGYPTYLHNLMQAEATNSKDWQTAAQPGIGYGGGDWVPNWNSPNYLSRLEALLNAIAAHINTTSHNGKNYRDVIFYVDIRGYGDFGEWQNYPYDKLGGTFAANTAAPTGRRAVDTSLIRIINAHKTAFANYPLMIPMGVFQDGSFSIVPGNVTNYAMTTTNNWGEIGWRRDNWGDDGYDGDLRDNTSVFNGITYSTWVLNKYKTAVVGGEPANDLNGVSRNPPGDGTAFGDLLREIQLYHAMSFGNGNYPISATNTALQNNIRAASKAAGYRLLLDSIRTNSTWNPGTLSNVVLYWKNSGIAPVYEDWNCQYQLRDANNVVQFTQNSTFKLKLFYKATGDSAVSDNLALPSNLPVGNYTLVMIIKDPANYKAPLPLAITGRATDGSYVLKNVVVVASSGSNQAPIANAGSNQTITLPTSTANLSGTASTDADGTISSYSWTKLSGNIGGTITSPNSSTTTITGLQAGVYTYRLTVVDNGGLSNTADVTITVNFAVTGPVTGQSIKVKAQLKGN